MPKIKPAKKNFTYLVSLFGLQATDGKDSVNEYDILHGDLSWMREVNPARFEEEQNMEAICTSQNQVLFRSTRGILDGEELRVWPTPSLEQQFGIIYPSLGAEFKGLCATLFSLIVKERLGNLETTVA